MNTLRQWLDDPRRRRLALIWASGALIAAGLTAEHLLRRPDLQGGLMAAAALVAGGDIAVRAVRGLAHKQVTIELLVTVATAGALVIGEFWEAAAVTFLFLFGAYLEARTLSRTRQALQKLLDLAPMTAVVVRDGRQVEVMPAEVEVGETVVVKPGAKVPVDGEVASGRAWVDESAITGESIPVEKAAGSPVFAGTLNQDGLLFVRATGVGADTTLARIVRRVEEAQEARAPAQRFVERFARWYTPFIIGLSAVAFAVTRDLELALTLLVIGCPGALVISTPVSIVAGIGRSAQRGILIKGGEYLENAGKISALALDKTGTLTQGKPRLTDVIALETILVPAGVASPIGVAVPDPAMARTGGDDPERWSWPEREVLRWAAIAEAGSEHPLARPILAAAESLWTIPAADDFATFTGRGIRAGYQGRTIAVGTEDLMEALEIPVDAAARAHLARLKAAGKTAVLVALDGVTIGVLGIADSIRPAAPTMVRRLKEVGVKRIVMLTGDDPRTARAIADQAGIVEVRAGLLPEDKLEAIRELQREGHVVAMVGDGVNDAPALAAADIGMAMGAAGTGVAIETAAVALMADDLMKIPEAVGLSKATLRNIRQNVIVALLTVAGLLAGVLLGEVHMAGGMLIHEASVLIVILNGMRLLRA